MGEITEPVMLTVAVSLSADEWRYLLALVDKRESFDLDEEEQRQCLREALAGAIVEAK